MPEKFSKMRTLVAAVAGPRTEFDTRESWLARAARTAGISYRQCKAAFYGEISDPEHKTIRRLQAAAEREAKREASELAVTFERIARGMNAADPNFYSATSSALLDVARSLRGMDRARNSGGDG